VENPTQDDSSLHPRALIVTLAATTSTPASLRWRRREEDARDHFAGRLQKAPLLMEWSGSTGGRGERTLVLVHGVNDQAQVVVGRVRS